MEYTSDKIVAEIDKYSAAIPHGAAVLSVEQFLNAFMKDKLDATRSDNYKIKRDKLKKLIRIAEPTCKQIEERETLKREVLNEPPKFHYRVRLSFCEKTAINRAYSWNMIDGSSNSTDKYLRIVLPMKALERFQGNDGNPLNCPYRALPNLKEDEKCKIVECTKGKGGCQMKKMVRKHLGHEISHLLDYFFEYVPATLNNNQKEDLHFDFAIKLSDARNAYLKDYVSALT